ncbi:shikimate dehydrogenase [Roseomonas sp. KE2513]|uniref:shikimate dehydrogenase family protein n=1 Tax=Roseomonas sp. KE2513 TaxID=2479202 RepID=UPI001E4335B8|nr:shikimate dehydrogenase [Roseomonas sp. KE2513]MBI0539350.1 shikimate dehydrogenase [Roseomonas sp. KE2513]
MSDQMIPSPEGATRLYAVIGDPVTQVLAPRLMNRLFANESIDAVMVPVQASAERLSTVVEGLKSMGNCDGILVTIPHKFAVAHLVERRSGMVELTGAANALRRDPDGGWSADNFDGRGFVTGLLKAGQDLRSRPIILFGAGGAGVAIAAALLERGARELHVVDPVPGKAVALAARLSGRWPGAVNTPALPPLKNAAVVINATPLGLRAEDPLPFEPSALSPGTRVADIIMKPAETTLLREAASFGLPVQPGIHMLAEQIGLYREFFCLGEEAPIHAFSPVL